MKACRLTIALVAVLLAGCTGSATRPKSGGRPYEVVVVGDVDSTVFRLLSAEVTGLPQAEPEFDVKQLARKDYKGLYRYARNIVVVDIDSARHPRPSLRLERDRYAVPQYILHAGMPSARALKSEKVGQNIFSVFDKAERQRALSYLQRRRNLQAEQTISRMFGARLQVPAELKASKRGKDFIWLSDNGTTVMRNLCVYKVSRSSLSAGMEYRDSVMKANIKGETDDMYMRTVPYSPTFCIMENDSGLLTRGLWEMQGDAMGGPFASRAVRTKGGFLIVEVFVYAPASKKRNIMRQLEASLYTFKPNHYGK